MSHIYVRLVLKTTLPRPKKLVCVAIAHHVDKLGEGCYASYSTLAEETSYEERQVMRIVAELEQDEIIVYQRKHPQYDTNVWNIDKGKLPMRATRQPKRAREAVVQLSIDESEMEDAGQPHSDESEMEDAAIEEFWASIGDPVPGNVTSGGDISNVTAASARSDVPFGSDVSDVTPGSDISDVTPGSDISGVTAAAASNVTPGSDILGQEGVTSCSFGPAKMSPNPSFSEKGSGKREKKGPTGSTLPPALDARVNPAAKTKLARERAKERAEAGEEDLQARDRPQTDLQRKVAQLCNAKYLTSATKAGLCGTVSTAWRGNSTKLPVTYPSPEDEWAANPELFAEYVELCARRTREESGRPPSRRVLVESIRRYARYNTGWLDFKQAAQEEARVAPPPKERPLYWDPNKPSWMQ